MQREWKMNVKHNHIHPYHNYNVEWLKPNPIGHALCDATYIGFKVRPNSPNKGLRSQDTCDFFRLSSGCGESWLGRSTQQPSGGLEMFCFLTWVLFAQQCSLFEDSWYYTLCVFLYGNYALVNFYLNK